MPSASSRSAAGFHNFGKSEISVDWSGKSVFYGAPGDVSRENVMSDQCSELVEISKLNGDFRRNYGKVLGAILYLRSVSAARGRSWFWAGLVSFACSVALAWLVRHGWTM